MAVSAGFIPSSGSLFYGPRDRITAPRLTRASLAEDGDSGTGGARRELHIGLCVPMGGLTGIWGPSALASAKLATAD